MTITPNTSTNTSTNITAPASTSGSAPRRRTGRTLTAVLGPVSLLFAVGCGAEPAGQDVPTAVAEEATGGAADVEPHVVDNTEQDQLRRIETSHGSDRHFGVVAERVAELRIRAVEGSDRHFGVIADRVTEARIVATEGSDRHLELLAAELAATDRG